MPRTTTRRRSHRGVLVLLALAVVGGGLAALWVRSHDGLSSAARSAAGATATDAPYDGSDDSLGGAPAAATSGPVRTPGGGAASSAASSAAATSSTRKPAPRQVQVTRTYSGWDAGSRTVSVGGYVSGIIEDGGTCTLTLTRGGTVVSGSSTAVPDARTTSCGAVRATGKALTSGEWSAVLSYSSPFATGQSATFTVVIP